MIFIYEPMLSLTMTHKYIDFEVIKESWNKYNLQDGTTFKHRSILQSVWLTKRKIRLNAMLMSNRTKFGCVTPRYKANLAPSNILQNSWKKTSR